jgi:hypothetical protein
MEDGKFWFNGSIRESFNFDEEVRCPNIELFLKRDGLTEVGFPCETKGWDFCKEGNGAAGPVQPRSGKIKGREEEAGVE